MPAIPILNGRLPDSLLKAVPWSPASRVAVAVLPSLLALDAAFSARFGHHLVINEGYRDYATQVAYYAHPPAGAGTAAKPGTSNHGLGLAVDLHLTADEYAWMLANAPALGWVNPAWARDDNPANGAKEPWHWEHIDAPSVTPDPVTLAPTRRPLMFVLIQRERGYWLCGPGHAHHLTGEEWNESVGKLRDAGLVGQFIFEDGPVGQRRFDLAKAALTQPSA